jgi:glyoxylase-like metal-dependent hydrolase (beta-lactamase superfamily II)
MNPQSLIIRQMELGPMMNFVYLIGCERKRAAAVIDPAWEIAEILQLADKLNLRLEHILITHAHPDHINGLETLLGQTSAKAYIQAEEFKYVGRMAAQFRVPIDFVDRYAERFQLLSDNDVIQVGSIPVQALLTPGHSPGSQCFLAEKNLFSGDTLFVDACGRVDLPGGDPARMWFSLNRRLRALDDDIVLYPGHSYGDRSRSTIGEQKRTNPYMQISSVEEFARVMGED